jgi:hypothetical protein
MELKTRLLTCGGHWTMHCGLTANLVASVVHASVDSTPLASPALTN